MEGSTPSPGTPRRGEAKYSKQSNSFKAVKPRRFTAFLTKARHTMNDKDYITIPRSELEELIEKSVAKALNQQPLWVRGTEGLMQIFNCSESTAKRIKKSGSIKKAIRQQGRTYLTNVPLALELYGTRNSRTF